MVSQFTKGHDSIKVVDGVMVLNLCTSSDDVLCFIFVPSFKSYRTNSMYWDRQVSANSADQDQTASEEAV